jgi:hypothetical protein
MSNFSITRPPYFVNMITESTTELSGGFITIPDVTVNYDSNGIISNGSIYDRSMYNIVSQGVPIPITFTSLFIKYGSVSGNSYAGSSLNRFIVTLYKNNSPTSLSITIDNPSSSDGPIIGSVSSNVHLTSLDTWTIHITPSTISGESPTTGSNIWCIYLTH